MQGTSGTYAINGTAFLLPPTKSNWEVRDTLGRDGNNRPIYPAFRDYNFSWDIMSTTEINQIINAQLSSVTGTLVMDLPKWGDTTYQFFSYSGTIANEPSVGEYFTTYVMNVSWKISNVRTN